LLRISREGSHHSIPWVQVVKDALNSYNIKRSLSNDDELDYLLEEARDIVSIARANRQAKELESKLVDNKFSSLSKEVNLLKHSIGNLTEENKSLRLLIQSTNREMMTILKKTLNQDKTGLKNAEKVHALEKQLKLEKKQIKEFEKSLKTREEELDEREIQLEEKEFSISEAVESVRNTDYGLSGKSIDPIAQIRILVFGDFKLEEVKIRNYIEKTFHELGLIEFSAKRIEFGPLKYDDVKNSGIYKKIKKDRYDLIFAGPHPHSNKDGNSNITLGKFIEKHNLKAYLCSDYNKPINQETIIKEIFTFSESFRNSNDE
jgi:hypothetical protein